jgi:hypothetical protein
MIPKLSVRLIALALLLGLCIGAGWSASSQEAVEPVEVATPTPLPTPPPRVDQHWHIVPDVAPVDLERQLKILNEAGITVLQSEMVLVGDKFTIIVSEEEPPSDEE